MYDFQKELNLLLADAFEIGQGGGLAPWGEEINRKVKTFLSEVEELRKLAEQKTSSRQGFDAVCVDPQTGEDCSGLYPFVNG